MSAASLFERSLNHLLAQNPGATTLLSQHAGQHLRLDLGFKQLDFAITAEGQLIESPTAAPDATLRATSSVLMQLPFLGREAMRHAEYSGDAALLQTLNQVFREVRWDIEAELAPLVGDIAAHRVAGAARQAAHTLRHAGQALQTSSSEYVVEEIALLARKSDVARFCAEVDTLGDDLARLEARLARLEAKLPLNKSTPPQA